MQVKPEDNLSASLPLIVGDCDQDDNEESNNLHNASTASFLKTCFNGLNALSGVGILSVPYALSSGGWLSLTLLFGIAIITFYSGMLIKRCMDFDPNIATYPDIGKIAFGKIGRVAISVFMYLELYLVSTGFLILESDNLCNLFPGISLELAGFTIDGYRCFVLLVALVIWPSVLLDDISLLSYVSAGGVIASIVILGSIVWTGAFDEDIGFDQRGFVLNWSGIPTSIILYAFCYCAHPVFPTLYTSMRNRNQFSKVLVTCFVIATVTYASMAVFGYLMFGSEIESQITLNLPTDKISSRVAIWTTLITPIAKYSLMITPIVDALKSCSPNSLSKRFLGMMIGTTILTSSVIVALIMPFFASLMSLVGAFLSVTASIIFPCLCYLKISGNYQRLECEMVILVAIIVVGIGVAIVGTYVSVLEVIKNLNL